MKNRLFCGAYRNLIFPGSGVYEIDTFVHKGHTFRVGYFHDNDTAAPWEEDDGHGIVSDWTTRGKKPEERVLVSDLGGHKRYYDVVESQVIALRDGWDCEKRRAMAAANPERKWTKREIAAMAVESDFEHLRGWCLGEWFWCGLIVSEIDEDGEPIGDHQGLYGCRGGLSMRHECLRREARNLADEIIAWNNRKGYK